MARPKINGPASAKSETERIIPKAGEQDLKFILPNNRRNAVEIIASSQLIKNPATGEVEQARYIYGLTSIWVKEQPSEGLTRKDPIVIDDGELFVPKSNKRLQEFLLLSSDFGKKYILEDLVGDAERELARKDLILDAEILLKEKSRTETGKSELRDIARYFGYASEGIDISIIRQQLSERINTMSNGAKDFLDAFQNDDVRAKSKVLRAAELGLFDFNSQGVARYSGETEVLCAVPSGMSHADAVAHFIQTPKGADARVRIDAYIEDNS